MQTIQLQVSFYVHVDLKTAMHDVYQNKCVSEENTF